MFVKSNFLRKVATVVACLAVTIMYSGCGKDKDKNGLSLGDDKEPTLGKASFGNTLTLSGQVHTMTENATDLYKKWTGSATVFAYGTYGEDGDHFTGKVTKGQLSISIGQPVPDNSIEYLSTVEEIFGDWNLFMVNENYSDVKFTPTGVKAYDLWWLDTEEYGSIVKQNQSYSDQGMFLREAIYIWVEKDVRLTAKGKKSSIGSSTEDIDLQFKKGWNAVYKKKAWADTPNLLKLGDPDLKWVIIVD